MMTPSQVEAVARRLIESRLATTKIDSLIASAIVDASGDPAWQVDAILADDIAPDVAAEARIDVMTELQQRLDPDDQRFAYLRFSTRAEVAEDAAAGPEA